MTIAEDNQQSDLQVEAKIPLKKLIEAANVATLLDPSLLATIGQQVTNDYAVDKGSRKDWEERNAQGMKLALQVMESKSFPWANCSSVKFPLVTVAALQFLARVSILTKGRQLVKCEVLGADPHGEEIARAKRISSHMSYQLTEEDTAWVDDDEKAKFSASIVGSAFKKSYFDPVEGINISEHVSAANLVVDYFTKSLEKANRVTQVLTMTRNDLQERVRRGVFLAMTSDESSTPEANVLTTARDEAAGTTRPAEGSTNTYEILEQHCFLDLDGDGYQEPYIAFVRSDTSQVLRIVARFFDEGDVYRVNDVAVRRLRSNAKSTEDKAAGAEYEAKAKKLESAKDNYIIRIVPMTFFTKIPFIPSPDGGFYDFGFGALLGPINESANTLINQLIDSGTMQTTAGGFLGRGVKLKAGKTSFDPFEWKPVDSTGDDLRKNIFPLPVRDPSPVLFQLLGTLVQYGEKISGATDIMTGANPGQNTPAETSRNTLEQGMKLFSGIYARMHRAFTSELKKLYRLNQMYFEGSAEYELLSGPGGLILQSDYRKGAYKVVPAADVQVVSESQRKQKAGEVLQLASSQPGYNKYLANKEYLEAMDVAGIEQLLPDPTGPNAIPVPPNPKLEIEKAKLELDKQQLQIDTQLAVVGLQQEALLNQAKIAKLEAEASKLLAQADGEAAQLQISAINAQIGAARAHQEGMEKALSIVQRSIDQRRQHIEMEHSQKLDIANQKEQGNADNTAR